MRCQAVIFSAAGPTLKHHTLTIEVIVRTTSRRATVEPGVVDVFDVY
jgi:hypothetical protein